MSEHVPIYCTGLFAMSFSKKDAKVQSYFTNLDWLSIMETLIWSQGCGTKSVQVRILYWTIKAIEFLIWKFVEID